MGTVPELRRLLWVVCDSGDLRLTAAEVAVDVSTLDAMITALEADEAACAECLSYRDPAFIDPTVQGFCRDGVGCRFADARAARAPLFPKED